MATPLKTTKSKLPRVVVCAAIQHKPTGKVICGARHGDCLAAAEYHPDAEAGHEIWELGFIDQDNVFMTRDEAWLVADAAGQIRRPTGFEQNFEKQRPANIGDKHHLFSENLY